MKNNTKKPFAVVLGCMILVALALVLSSSTLANAQPFDDHTDFETYQNEILGVMISYPKRSHIVSEQDYFNDTYGFVVRDKNQEASGFKEPIFSIEWVIEALPNDIEKLVEKAVAPYPTILIKVSPVNINGYDGYILSPMPGLSPNTLLLISANNRVYQIRYYGENSDDSLKQLVEKIVFIIPNRQLSELNIPHADDVLYIEPPDEIFKQLEESSTYDNDSMLPNNPESIVAPPAYLLSLQPGCTSDPGYVQTQWNRLAKGGSGKSSAGPNYWGVGGHIRCNSTDYYNNYYALDHALNEWDAVYPHRSGTVIYAGWAGGGWSTLGRMVVIDYGSNRWGVMAHLRSLSSAAVIGNYVNSSTHIGFAGGSGNYTNNYWGVHLHQSLHLNAKLAIVTGGQYPGGGIHDGQSARPNAIYHLGGVYYPDNMYSGMTMSFAIDVPLPVHNEPANH